jgi:hypothetical protein
MKRIFILFVLVLIAGVPPVLADNNTTLSNITPMDPLILSFQGGHMFGENPVEILDNQTGRLAFIGNTSSKGVNLSPDRGWIIRVEPAGVSDAANSPDAGVIGAMTWAEKNPFGTFFLSTLLAAILIASKRRI